ncbi:UDP-N-acetylmuramyl tripeptide synthase [Dokdonella immobilis]|uniref:UDP-N-acetylmuramyl tripeptide synthase n=1 Tax=Dokdonella immobilis TaxID=578942 RepID=A0A1I4Y5U5_9GAMM|nr:UDP-N-acetylmuramyl tripeptide synthase [Dokdonella immobilis]
MGRRRPRPARHPPVAGAGRLSAQPTLSFEDSRRLTGPNLYFSEPGAVLETVGPGADDTRAIAAWRDNVLRMRSTLGWPAAAVSVRAHRGGVALAFAAPLDQLFTATEVNEWAWQAARGVAELFAPGHASASDLESAKQMLQRHAAAERNPALMALLAAARRRHVPVVLDDDTLSLGLGATAQAWPLSALPGVESVPWDRLHAIPVALVTGSNGKTTTVRLLAAMLTAHGRRTGFSCTDGVFVEDQALTTGDYSGPAGARTVLRHREVKAAVLETARGGLLRRGLAIERADVAIVTNISDDHFGEYGIDDLDGLTETKLIVARALDSRGTLVLNADDAQLRAHASRLDCRKAWFALDDDNDLLRATRDGAGTSCGLRDGHLWLSHGPQRTDLGAIAAMPLSAGGLARYNITNMAGAVLLADALGIPAATIAAVLADFGRERGDNPGRLEQWSFGGIRVLLDYAHNPEGLRGLLSIARSLGARGRLGLILGQAGNRGEAEIRALAAAAASFHPDLVVLKDMEGFLRGRAAGEVAAVLRDELLAQGLPPGALPTQPTELAAVRHALAWARDGDLLVLPVHALKAKAAVVALLDTLQGRAWTAGETLPAD